MVLLSSPTWDADGGRGGRPDERFPNLSSVRQKVGEEGVLVSVVANVNLTKGTGTIAFVHPVTNLPASPIEPESQAVIRTQHEDGTLLDEFPVLVKLDSELAPDDDREGLLDPVLPVSAEAKTIELVIDGRVADTFRVGAEPPGLRAVQPIAVEEGGLRIGLEFERALEDAHTYAAQVSVDTGRSWQTTGVGLRDTSFTLDRSQFPEGQEVMVRIITTNGVSSCVVTGEPFRISHPKT